VITDPALVSQRAVAMVSTGRVESLNGKTIDLPLDTLCLHGDTPGAAELAAAVRRALTAAGIAVQPMQQIVRR
jgi:UPF0271 protein